MTTFLLFVAIALVLARYFEKKKMHVATVVHALQFLLILLCYLFAFDVPVLSDSIRTLVQSETAYEILHDATAFIVGGSAIPTKAIIVVWVLQLAVLAFAVTDEVIGAIKAYKTAEYVRRPRAVKPRAVHRVDSVLLGKRYIKLCRFLN